MVSFVADGFSLVAGSEVPFVLYSPGATKPHA